MDGFFHKQQIEQGYCWELLREYTILEAAQIHTLLKRYGQIMQKNKRFQIVKKMCGRQYIRHFEHEGVRYLSVRPDILPEGRYRHQIDCFWILLEYISQVDEHFATGMAFPIHMQIQDREYDIAYVEKGAERYYSKEIHRGKEKRYILIVEDKDMIPFLQGEQIAAVATIDNKRQISYYSIGDHEEHDI